MSSLAVRRAGRLSTAAVLLLVALAAGAQQAAAPALTHVVVVPVANMYRGASEDTDVVSQAIFSSNVSALADKVEWLKIRTQDEYTGWVKAAVLKKIEAPYAAGGSVVAVANLSANVYRETDVTKHAPMFTLPFDARLEVTNDKVDRNGRWLQVRLPDGRAGFVQAGDVSAELKPLSIDDTVALAKKFLGVTYTWGGTSSFGFDCSGFTQTLVKYRGKIMPRDADDQAAWSGLATVERKNLQAGDLLYFGSSAERITHTGMYIGDGQFIHDTTNTRPMVQISKLDDQPWTRLLVAARRLK